MTSEELVRYAVRILDAKKAEDIRAIDIGGVSIIADYFVIASGGSAIQVRALCDELDQKLAEAGYLPHRTEGLQTATWAILDYGDVVFHIFQRETRQFFNLERLWGDGRDLPLDLIPNETGAGDTHAV